MTFLFSMSTSSVGLYLSAPTSCSVLPLYRYRPPVRSCVQHRSVRLVCLACTFKTLNNAIYKRHQRGLSTLFVERDHVRLNIRVSIVACMPCIQQLRLNVVPTVFM